MTSSEEIGFWNPVEKNDEAHRENRKMKPCNSLGRAREGDLKIETRRH